MKKLSYLAFIMALFICPILSSAQVSKAEMQVSGLTCSMCQLATQKAVKTLDFVADIQPDLNNTTFIVTFKKDKTVNPDLLKKKVQGAGFSVSKLVLTYTFSDFKLGTQTSFNYGGANYRFITDGTKTLDGPTKITILDNGFVPAGAYKKMAANSKIESYKTGKSGSSRVYHISL